MWTVVVDVDGAITKLQTLADSAAELEKPLGQFGAYLLHRAREIYQEQNFEPLAESTIDKRAQRGLRIMNAKLGRDLRKAEKRAKAAAEAKREPRGAAARLLAAIAGINEAELPAQATRGVVNRTAVLHEFRRRHRIGGKDRAARLREVAGLSTLTLRMQQSLSMRTVRQVASTVGRPILGGLPQTLEVTVGAGTVTLRSRTREEWTDVHNEGGEAGQGAEIPQRQTIKIEPSDLDVFVSILKSHILLPLDERQDPGY